MTATSIPFQAVAENQFTIEVPADLDLAKCRTYLGINAAVSRSELVEKVPYFVLLIAAPPSRVGLPILSLRHVFRPSGHAPINPSNEYFEFDQVGRTWEAIRQSRRLAAYVPPVFPSATLELLVVPRLS